VVVVVVVVVVVLNGLGRGVHVETINETRNDTGQEDNAHVFVLWTTVGTNDGEELDCLFASGVCV
jgi:hypothetical protein